MLEQAKLESQKMAEELRNVDEDFMPEKAAFKHQKSPLKLPDLYAGEQSSKFSHQWPP